MILSNLIRPDFRHIDSMNLFAYFIFLSLLALGVCNSALSMDVNSEETKLSSEDRELHTAYFKRDFAEFQEQIDSGANPTHWFGNTHEGWIFCAATEVGREPYLQLIIDAGFDVNFRQEKSTSDISTPLFCAITLKNILAVEMLLNAGADQQTLYCPDCTSTIATSALWLSTLGMNFEMSNTSYSTDQLQAIVTMIETLPFPKDSPRHPIRNEFVDLLRAKGFSVTPWYDENFR